MSDSHPTARLRSVRVRITVAATVVVAATMALASFGLVRAVRHQLLGGIEQRGKAKLQAIAGQLAGGVPPGGVALQPPGPATGFATVQDAQGRVVKAAGVPNDAQAGVVIAGTELPPGKLGAATLDAAGGPFALSYTKVPTLDSTFTVIVGSPLDSVRSSIAALEGTLALGFPFLVAMVAGLAWLVTGRALRPVEAMRSEVEEISGGTLHRRVPDPQTGDEVGRLAHTMNDMLDRLEAASQRQRQFVSDASHELRSPVAAIRAQLEVALAQAASAGDAGVDWPAVARKALGEEARLEALVSDLLLLASTDEQHELQGAVDVDLAALLADEVSRPRHPVPELHMTDDGGSCRILGVPDQLGRVAANLLDNACRHARQHVAISLTGGDGEVRVIVDDDGPGIPVADRERVFERFTRLDQARVRTERGGAGLGLALARAIIERHHGTIHIDGSPSGGTRVEVTLPGA
jgi:signal transduction histidine kinase